MTRGHRPAPGFTLIELLVTITVLAIITAAAVASYGSSVVKTRRGAAQACLLEGAQFMERYYTMNMSYAGADPTPACATELAGFYSFAFVGTPDATSYTLQATPAGPQADDTLCATLTLDNFGVKGEGGSAADAGECW